MKMLDKYFSTKLELSKKNLKNNIDFLKKNIGSNKEIIAVLKANAYGFGDIILSKEIIKHGITEIAVADFEEGLRLRKNKIKVPIMIMYPALRNLKPIIDNKLEPSIYSLEMLNKLIFHAKKRKKLVTFHLKIDTGMNRYGFLEENIKEVICKIKKQKNLKIKSVFSHLSSSKLKNHKKFTLKQIQKFNYQKSMIQKEFLYKIKSHISNSYGAINYMETNSEMIRVGFGLYYGFNNKQTYCIGQLKTSISQIKVIKKGDSVGYNRRFISKKIMKIGVIPIGYADGLRRDWVDKKLYFTLNNIKLPVIGEISMDSCVIDLSKIKEVKEGDNVTLFGESRCIFKLSKSLQTIPYEITSGLSKRIRRILV